uniref:Uncharacterized protein n=1 Tax=Panagrolaimus sp. PS1159 TaxID=55785 RepID=A0AC35F614_9BILA
MSIVINKITWPPSRKVIFTIAGIAGGVAFLGFLKRWYFSGSHHSRRISRLPDQIEAFDSLGTTILYLEKLLVELEKVKLDDESQRNRYELIHSILLRLKGAKSDFEKFRRNDFGTKDVATEDIARTLWYSAQTPRASTLSVLSDDSFVSAVEELATQSLADFETNSISIDFAELAFYREGLAEVKLGKVKVRKLRTEFCGCDSDDDFLAKVYCLRKAFDKILENERTRQWFIQQGKIIFADLMRQDHKNPTDFLTAYDKLMDFLTDSNNYERTKKELEMRKVEAVNIWDVLLDFVLLDSFDDLRKPPSSMVALFRNNFLSRSLKESTLNNLVWSMIKYKRQKLVEKDGFVSHFYDVSQIVSPMLIYAFIGDGPKAFQELCLYFKESVYSFVAEIFNLQKVRYTSVGELAEDLQQLLERNLETLYVKITTELIPA